MRLVFVAVDFLREPCLLVGPCSPRCEPVPYRVSANKAPKKQTNQYVIISFTVMGLSLLL